MPVTARTVGHPLRLVDLRRQAARCRERPPRALGMQTEWGDGAEGARIRTLARRSAGLLAAR